MRVIYGLFDSRGGIFSPNSVAPPLVGFGVDPEGFEVPDRHRLPVMSGSNGIDLETVREGLEVVVAQAWYKTLTLDQILDGMIGVQLMYMWFDDYDYALGGDFTNKGQYGSFSLKLRTPPDYEAINNQTVVAREGNSLIFDNGATLTFDADYWGIRSISESKPYSFIARMQS